MFLHLKYGENHWTQDRSQETEVRVTGKSWEVCLSRDLGQLLNLPKPQFPGLSIGSGRNYQSPRGFLEQICESQFPVPQIV